MIVATKSCNTALVLLKLPTDTFTAFQLSTPFTFLPAYISVTGRLLHIEYICRNVFIGCLFLFGPGIYIGISFTFGSYLLILRDNGLGKIITESMAMVKGNWWKTFGFIVVMYLLVGVLAYLFGIPYMFLMMSSAFTGEIPNIYEITFSLLLSYLGQYTLYTVLFVGVGMLFFSRSEEMEHTTLLSQIDQLGAQPEKKADEEAN